jgi:MFS superfamily sulfate permease-like transporter
MEDEHSESKKPIWVLVGVSVGISIVLEWMLNWPAVHGQGFNPFQWDNLLAMVVGVVASRWLVRQRKVDQVTTLGIGEITAKKLQSANPGPNLEPSTSNLVP